MLANENCLVLAATNSPEIDSKYIIDIFKTHANEFDFVRGLPNLQSYPALDEEKSLKNLIFKRESLTNN